MEKQGVVSGEDGRDTSAEKTAEANKCCGGKCKSAGDDLLSKLAESVARERPEKPKGEQVGG